MVQPNVTTSTTTPSSGPTQKQKTEEKLREYGVPTVRLEQDRLTDTMAAGLAMSLLGHVLFLKGQVPFPVMQMLKMPASQADSRASKKRQELLSSLDILSCHLQTTFTALSHAIASRMDSADPAATPGSVPSPPTQGSNFQQVYMMMILGPSVNAAKARVVLVVDGLEVKLLGERYDKPLTHATTGDISEQPTDNQSESDDSEEEHDDSDLEDSEEEEFNDESVSDEDALESDYETASESEETGSAPAPPLSRSPSPEQEQLRAAERLLSRTLANACAEDDGMQSELAPTQAHILLRAPRRFGHPSWTPRQMWTSSLEAILTDFLDESGINRKDPEVTGMGKQKVHKRGVKTEGVFVGCNSPTGRYHDAHPSQNQDEDDEMIWWSWNGKIAGFSDW
ncbi:hypothetical protein GLOTRDRAFT_71521 [Gloeophyllum trabeum ATCC 11539]|uniref:Uncharacterized protein n=1 Tax=Gloeophyllum trabeum (strain ATCC 11539 / FP-39264 / Madison 617) TaxID=670483 RepID=S7QKB4_GLOTA|nr:uncharacterized protein GLOTRDRAFT_71521 [Gloeophyllum trabeum ATCC 11539]EPQ59827.1 hypothetical protein GLOTRDRAFT_71521 [Gloeophyllum trabeum ATCC 11539]